MNFFQKLTTETTADINECLNLVPRCFGKKNKDKLIYYICEDNGDLGFFAMYRYWAEYLYFADICNYFPVIFAGNSFAYREEKSIHGTKNPFEYYFLQPSRIELNQVNLSNKVIYSNLSHRKIVELVFTGKISNYMYTQKYMETMSEIVKKSFKFNKFTWKFISDSIEKIDLHNKKILGVHIRGTDFRGCYNNHPIYVDAQDCFHVIDRLLDNKKYNKVFVATDDKRILTKFIAKYGNRMCYYKDVVRSDKNVSVAFRKEKRKYHKYRLGLEVIRDMYTLALCDGLVAGLSQVAVCAQMNKMAIGKVYEDLEIIDKGVYKNTRFFHKHR